MAAAIAVGNNRSVELSDGSTARPLGPKGPKGTARRARRGRPEGGPKGIVTLTSTADPYFFWLVRQAPFRGLRHVAPNESQNFQIFTSLIPNDLTNQPPFQHHTPPVS